MAESTKGKKESKTPVAPDGDKAPEGTQVITTAADLKAFLQSVRDKMTEEVAAPIYAMSAMNRVLNMSNIYDLLDNDNKEIARDIWLRLKQAGMQLHTPPLLFSAEEDPNRITAS